MALRGWEIPEGLRVLPDGTWQTGDLPVVHAQSLAFFKSHLVFEDGGAFVVEGLRRMPIALEGPAFAVVRLALDHEQGEARLVLDDGSEEPVSDGSIGMDEQTGRFEGAVRGGRARALFGRAAHQQLLDHAEQVGGDFFLRVGRRLLALRT